MVEAVAFQPGAGAVVKATMTLSLFVALALAASVAACATGPRLSALCTDGQPSSIEGDWVLTALDGAPPVARADMTLIAEEAGFGGGMSCNGFGTVGPDGGGEHYEIADGRLVVAGDIISTTAGCLPRELMATETAYIDILLASPHVARQTDALCLYTDDGRSLEFRPQVAEAEP